MTVDERRERFCVIADDLTGAMDTGVGLAQAGLSAIISFSPTARLESDAVVVTTDSRAESATAAYHRVKLAGERYSRLLHLQEGRFDPPRQRGGRVAGIAGRDTR